MISLIMWCKGYVILPRLRFINITCYVFTTMMWGELARYEGSRNWEGWSVMSLKVERSCRFLINMATFPRKNWFTKLPYSSLPIPSYLSAYVMNVIIASSIGWNTIGLIFWFSTSICFTICCFSPSTCCWLPNFKLCSINSSQLFNWLRTVSASQTPVSYTHLTLPTKA